MTDLNSYLYTYLYKVVDFNYSRDGCISYII